MVADITPETEANERRQVRISHDEKKRARDDEEIGFSDDDTKKGGRGQHREEAVEIDSQESALPSGLNEGEQAERKEDDWRKYLKEGKSGVGGESLGDWVKVTEHEEKPEDGPEDPELVDETPEVPLVSEEKKSKPTYNVSIKGEERARLTPREEADLNDFASLWASGQVTEISFSVNTSAKDPVDPKKNFPYVDRINMTGDGGKMASIAVRDLVKRFNGVSYFRVDNGIPVGIRFMNGDKGGEYIYPVSNPGVAKKILLRVNFNGQPLKNRNFKVNFAWSIEKSSV